MTNASKLPSLNLGHAMQTEPRALEAPPSSVQSDRLPKPADHTHCTCKPNVFLRNEVVTAPRVYDKAQRAEMHSAVLGSSAPRSGLAAWVTLSPFRPQPEVPDVIF